MAESEGVSNIAYKSRLSNFRLLAELIRRRSAADVYHGHSLMSIPLMLTSRPYVAHFHGSDVREVVDSDTRLGMLLRLAMRRAAHVVHCTEDLAEPIFRAGVDPVNMTWLPNPIDTFRFCPGGREGQEATNEDFTILHPQPVQEVRKNDLFFEAFIRVARDHAGVRLVWVQHPRFLEAQSRAEEKLTVAGVMTQVKKVARISPELMPDLLNSADVVVDWFNRDLPAVSQTSLEAMACGRPVIAGLPLDHSSYLHESGILPGGTVDTIEASLRQLLSRPESVAQLGRQGREWVENHHGCPVVLRKLTQVYSSVLGEKYEV